MCTMIVLTILATIYVYKYYSEISIGEKKFELKTADIIPQNNKKQMK